MFLSLNITLAHNFERINEDRGAAQYNRPHPHTHTCMHHLVWLLTNSLGRSVERKFLKSCTFSNGSAVFEAATKQHHHYKRELFGDRQNTLIWLRLMLNRQIVQINRSIFFPDEIAYSVAIIHRLKISLNIFPIYRFFFFEYLNELNF